MRGRIAGLALAAIAACLFVAPPAEAAQTFGADLTQNPANGCAASCTLVTQKRHDASSETGSPVAGILTKVRLKYAGVGGQGRFYVLGPALSGPSPPNFRNTAPDNMPFSVPGTSTPTVYEFSVRRPIAVGQRLGLFAETMAGTAPGGFGPPPHRYESVDADAIAYIKVGAHAADTDAPYDPFNQFELLVNGTVEPDADGDGFGDETQDGCLASNGSESGCPPAPAQSPSPSATPATTQVTPPADTTAPTVSALTATRTAFAVGRVRTPLVAVRRGTTFRYSTSEPGTATFTIQRARPGRRVGRRCLFPTRARRSRPRCTRHVRAGVLRRTASQGRNSLPFTGRIGRAALRPGRYRLVLVVRDAAGNRSRAKVLRFTVLPG